MADAKPVRFIVSPSPRSDAMKVVWVMPHVLSSENQTQKTSNGASSASAIEEVPKFGMALEDVRVNNREIRDAFRVFEKGCVDENGAPFLAWCVPERHAHRHGGSHSCTSGLTRKWLDSSCF